MDIRVVTLRNDGLVGVVRLSDLQVDRLQQTQRRADAPHVVHLHGALADLLRDAVLAADGGPDDDHAVELPVEIAPRILVVRVEALDLLGVLHRHDVDADHVTVLGRDVFAVLEGDAPAVAMYQRTTVHLMGIERARGIVVDALLLLRHGGATEAQNERNR